MRSRTQNFYSPYLLLSCVAWIQARSLTRPLSCYRRAMALKALDQRMASSSKPATLAGGPTVSIPMVATGSGSGTLNAGDAVNDEVVKEKE